MSRKENGNPQMSGDRVPPPGSLSFLFFICVYLCSSVVPLLLACGVSTGQSPQSEEQFSRAREQMVRTQIASRPAFDFAPVVRDPRVLGAMRKVPRHKFVPPELAARAYGDHPLPIGHGQTISQPYIVAIMTELARPQAQHRALEIGTGSGYQAAVLSELVREVYTIELLEPLGTTARDRLRDLGYANVTVRIGDGYQGWPEKAPFDLILVTAGAPFIPPALLEQLAPGGRMVIPVGAEWRDQVLKLISKDKDGRIRSEDIMGVRFVPLVPGEKKNP
jgi:protein-L-isoaspartate(D-aspartate) O-methyltransferase